MLFVLHVVAIAVALYDVFVQGQTTEKGQRHNNKGNKEKQRP